MLTGSPRAAMWFFWVIFLPGTLLHELSHWLTAQLLRVDTVDFSLWPQTKKGGVLQMGAVQVDVSDPFRHSLIGLAPLLFGSGAVLLIGYGWLNLGQIGQALVGGNLPLIWQAVQELLALPDIGLWLYLVFAISNAMLPSASDREAWRTVLIYLGLTLVVAVGLGINPTISPAFQDFVLTGVAYLLSAFVITIAVDLLFILFIFFTETILSLIRGRWVQYNS